MKGHDSTTDLVPLTDIFTFLQDHQFCVSPEVWQGFLREKEIAETDLKHVKSQLMAEMGGLQSHPEQIPKLEQLFCCDPFEPQVVKCLRDSWYEQGQRQPEPWQKWCYQISLQLLQFDEIQPSDLPKTSIETPPPLEPKIPPITQPVETSVKKSRFSGIWWLMVPLTLISFALGLFISHTWRNYSMVNSRDNQRNVRGNNWVSSLDFPLASCGDQDPGGKRYWYPVFVKDSAQNLMIIRQDYCQDAFRKYRQTKKITSIQVASFFSRERAEDFAAMMREQVGSGEVGQPTFH